MTINFPVGDWYFPITFEHDGLLKTISAKMSVETDIVTGDNVATIEIPETAFLMGDTGCFTFTTIGR